MTRRKFNRIGRAADLSAIADNLQLEMLRHVPNGCFRERRRSASARVDRPQWAALPAARTNGVRCCGLIECR